jgi:hypothetical protein
MGFGILLSRHKCCPSLRGRGSGRGTEWPRTIDESAPRCMERVRKLIPQQHADDSSRRSSSVSDEQLRRRHIDCFQRTRVSHKPPFTCVFGRTFRRSKARDGHGAFGPRDEKHCVNRDAQRLFAGLNCLDEVVTQSHDRLLHFRELIRREASCLKEIPRQGLFAQLSAGFREADPVSSSREMAETRSLPRCTRMPRKSRRRLNAEDAD